MQLRASLWKIDLTGSRRMVRRISTWAIATFAAAGALGYVLPTHKHGGEWHSNYADGGPFSLAVFALVLGATLALRHRRLGSGMLSGFVASAGAIAALAPVLLAHLFSHVDHGGAGEGLFEIGVVGLVFGGVAMIVTEPFLYVLERRGRRMLLPIARALA